MRIITLSLAVLALTGAAIAFQQPTADKGTPQDAAVISKQLPSYPLDVCPVSKEKLGGAMEGVNLVQDGRLVRFCCKDCVADFKKDPAPVLKQIDDAVIKAQKAGYAMTKCPVSGKELASATAPIDFVSGTRLVRFCCKDCVESFKKDSAKYMAQVDQAMIDAQKKSYPLTTCPISTKPIEGAGVDYLYGTRLVRFCCPKCPDAFLKDPTKTLAQIDAAAKNPKAAPASAGGAKKTGG